MKRIFVVALVMAMSVVPVMAKGGGGAGGCGNGGGGGVGSGSGGAGAPGAGGGAAAASAGGAGASAASGGAGVGGSGAPGGSPVSFTSKQPHYKGIFNDFFDHYGPHTGWYITPARYRDVHWYRVGRHHYRATGGYCSTHDRRHCNHRAAR